MLEVVEELDVSDINLQKMPFKEFIIKMLVGLLSNPDKLFAMIGIIKLFGDFGKNLNTSVMNLENSTFFGVYKKIDDYSNLRLKIFIDELKELNFQQHAKLMVYVTEVSRDGFSQKTYSERLENLIDSLMRRNEFRKIIGIISDINKKQIQSALFKSNAINEVQSIEAQLSNLSSLGDDRSLESHGADPYYWYSIGDGLRLLQAIRQEKLDYKKSRKQQYPCKLGEELSCVRENKSSIFIADSYVMKNFAIALDDDIKTITGQHKGKQKAKNNVWEIMPKLLIFPVLISNHWCVIRAQINYEKRSASILWDDPYGEEHFDKKLQVKILDILKTNILKLFKKQNLDELNLSAIQYEQFEKTIDQQGESNGWDCGVIAFSNIHDYADSALSNKELSNIEISKFTIGCASDQQHNNLIAETRRLHVEWFNSIEGSLPVVEADDTLAQIIDVVYSDNDLIGKFSQLTHEKIDQIIQKIIIMQFVEASSKLTIEIIQAAYDEIILKLPLEKSDSTASLFSLPSNKS